MTHWDWLVFRLRVEDLILRFFFELGRSSQKTVRSYFCLKITAGFSVPYQAHAEFQLAVEAADESRFRFSDSIGVFRARVDDVRNIRRQPADLFRLLVVNVLPHKHEFIPVNVMVPGADASSVVSPFFERVGRQCPGGNLLQFFL